MLRERKLMDEEERSRRAELRNNKEEKINSKKSEFESKIGNQR